MRLAPQAKQALTFYKHEALRLDNTVEHQTMPFMGLA
jgi:hypothetical protein